MLPALVDTGASMSCISREFYRKIVNRAKVEKTSQHFNLHLADGSQITIRKMVRFSFAFEGRKYNWKFCVVPGLKRQAILGIDFLRYYNGKLTFANMDTSHLTCTSAVSAVLPPNAETSILCKVNRPNNRKTIGVTDNIACTTPVQYAVKRCLVSPSDDYGLIPVTLYNSST